MNQSFPARWLFLACLGIAFAISITPSARTQTQKHLTIYAPSAVYSVPIISFDGQDYVGLADLLEPLGNVDARVDGKRWKLHFTPSNGVPLDAEFGDGNRQARVRTQDLPLSGSFHLENGRGYVRSHDIASLLPAFIGFAADLHENSNRLFLGNVAVKYTVEMQKSPAPRLALNFSAPVNPTIATEPGHVRLVFRRDPIVNSGAENNSTGDPTITGSSFTDAGGTPQITVSGSAPLTATFANGNRTIYISPAPSGAPPAEAANPVAPATPPPAQPVATPAPPPAAPAPPRFLVIIDAAHGGDERGAAITKSLPEKDVNLALAHRLQHELQNKGVNATLLRTADTNIPLDDRAIAVNSAHPSLYVCLHSANLGTGARIFTALMAPSAAAPHSFLPWPQAQAPFLDQSSQFAGSISAELNNRQIPVTAFPVPLRPMRNIAAPAIAIEIAPPDENVVNINSADYQQNLVAAIANGITAMRPKVQVTH